MGGKPELLMLDPKTFSLDSRVSAFLPAASPPWVTKKQLGSKFLTYQQCWHLFYVKVPEIPIQNAEIQLYLYGMVPWYVWVPNL